VLTAAGPAAVDAFSVGPWTDDLDSPANRRMVSDFEGEYGRAPSLYAAQGYDAAMLLDAVIKATDKRVANADLLINALRRTDFPSTRGSFRFDTNQFPIQTYLVRQVVRDPRDRIITEQRGLLVRDARDGHAGECPMRWAPETVAGSKG
jgi:branched-chain amino acid transport system substrate-binding protein